MPIVPFTIYTTIGTIIWTTALTTLGYKLGSNYELVDEYLAPVSKIVLGILVLAFAAWLVKKNLDLRNKGNG
jgi:membrane protein DedA with SNARE-associated domain